MSKEKTLILIDGHALAFRQYYALERTGMKNSENQPTWAVYGFFKAIFDLLAKIKPDFIAVTFVPKSPKISTSITRPSLVNTSNLLVLS